MRRNIAACLVACVLCLLCAGYGSALAAEPKSAAQSEKQIKTGTYSYAQEGMTGELMLFIPWDEKKSPKPKYNVSIQTASDLAECQFEGECIFKGGKLMCYNDDIKADKENFIEIDINSGGILDVSKVYTVCGHKAYINGIYKPTCLDKILGTNTVTGTYLGYFEAEEGFNTIGVKLENGSDLSLIASEEEANQFFGNNKNKKISVTYATEQTWLDNACGKINVLKSGKMLEQ